MNRDEKASEDFWRAQQKMQDRDRRSGGLGYMTASGYVFKGSEEDLKRNPKKEQQMSFENKPQTASVFPNKDKTPGDSKPNARGSIYLSREFLTELLQQEGSLIKADISFWTKTSASGTPWMSGAIQKPYKLDTPAAAAPVAEEAPKPAADIPF